VGGMTDFLLELRSEEIPARMQDKAREDLARLFTAELDKAGLKAGEIVTYATPRRLALMAKGLPLETEAVSEETKGPKAGAPPQAMEGFLCKVGLTQDQLVERDGVYFAVVNKPGRKTADVLAEAIPAIIRAFPWPKSQRWGAASISTESLRWVRPLQGIVALLGDDVVPCEVDGIMSGSATMGHRFHHSGEITIGNAADYAVKLRAAHVIVDQDERRQIIRAGAEKAASDAGLMLVPDEGLVNENSGLTEWPVPMVGRFDPAFLDVPQEVIQLTARVNQKYFVCHDADGKLAPAFVCTANIVASDGGAMIAQGNEKVLASRLSDAKFFWEQDLKIPLDEQAKKLSQITFHEKLGTVADKVERVAKLARWLVEEGIVKGASADAAERAARLCKADLVTGMVGEFPELQGIMGGYYARAQGEPDAVADAVRDHYKPVGQGDDVPTAPVTVAVSLADKLDTLVGFFGINERPTGSKDPFALRRATLAVIRLIKINNLRLPLRHLFLVARAFIIENWASRYAIVSIQESDDEPVPVLEAKKLLGATGEIFAFDWSVPAEDSVSINNTSNFAYSRRYLEEYNAIDLRLMSLDDLTGNLFQYFCDRLEEAEKAVGTRVDLIRSIIPREILKFSLDDLFLLDTETPTDGKSDFLKIRLRNWGISDDLVALLARVKALQAFVTTDEGGNLLAGYKRAANILKADGSVPSPRGGEGQGEGALPSDSVHPHPTLSLKGEGLSAEIDLDTALTAAEPLAAAAIAAEDFAAAMTALASLRAPIDAFFEGVMVNDPDPAKRAFRLGLLTRFRDAVHKVADFSKIEG
jgi:glycyl-tRNA synthetase beta chain